MAATPIAVHPKTGEIASQSRHTAVLVVIRAEIIGVGAFIVEVFIIIIIIVI